MRTTSVRYPRNNFKIFLSWQDNYTTAELRNDQSRFSEVSVDKVEPNDKEKVKHMCDVILAL